MEAEKLFDIIKTENVDTLLKLQIMLNAHVNKVKLEKICIVCCKTYISLTKRSKYCSDKCKHKRNRKPNNPEKENRDCVICGTQYSVSKYSNSKTCSTTCRSKYRWRNN